MTQLSESRPTRFFPSQPRPTCRTHRGTMAPWPRPSRGFRRDPRKVRGRGFLESGHTAAAPSFSSGALVQNSGPCWSDPWCFPLYTGITWRYPLKARIQFEKTMFVGHIVSVFGSYGLSKYVAFLRKSNSLESKFTKNSPFPGLHWIPNVCFVGRQKQLCYTWWYIPCYPSLLMKSYKHISVKSLFWLVLVWPLHVSGPLFFFNGFTAQRKYA